MVLTIVSSDLQGHPGLHTRDKGASSRAHPGQWDKYFGNLDRINSVQIGTVARRRRKFLRSSCVLNDFPLLQEQFYNIKQQYFLSNVS